MSITLTDEPQIIYPPAPTIDRERAMITAIVRDDTLTLRVNVAARRRLGLDPKRSHRVHVLLSRTQIFVQATPDGSRTLQSKGDIMASDLLPHLGMKHGDRLVIPADVDDRGRLVGEQPGKAIMRNKLAALKARKAGAA